MKIAYYIITIIISALATGLFLLISFPLNKESMSALLVAAMFVVFLFTNISGLIKKDFIPGIMLTKAGILLDGFGAFCIDAVFIGGHMSIPFCFFILLLWILGLVCILEGISICKSRWPGAPGSPVHVPYHNNRCCWAGLLPSSGMPRPPR